MLLRRVWPSRPAFENPFADFDQLRREMLRVFASAAGNNDGPRDFSAGVFPPMNVTQDDNNFYVRAEVPGIKRRGSDGFGLAQPGHHLGQTRDSRGAGGQWQGSYHRKERPQGEFNRSVGLPGEVATDKVEARYADGILTLTLPKAEETKPRQIAVRS